jgi:5,6-dimethylbenzimidazole synthase
MGWISMFDPEALRGLLQMPPGSCPVAILCLGRVDAFYPRPMLESQQWRTPADLASLVFHDQWGNDVDASAE